MKKQDDITTGPSVAKKLYPGQLGAKAEADQRSLKRQIFLYISGNFATGGFGALMAASVIGILFTLFVFAKGFLCPDLAVEKGKQNHAWYCEQKPDNGSNR